METNWEEVRKEGRRRYIYLQNKYGEAPEVRRDIMSTTCGGKMSDKKQMAINIAYWEKLEKQNG